MRSPSTSEGMALLVGVAHAALVVGVGLRYGYNIGPSAYPPQIVLWRYGGLVVLGGVPIWLALKDRLILPVALVTLLAGLAFYAELTPPAPTFQDVADLEPSIDGPTGITVVENGLYLVKYTSAWYVWTVGALFAGAWEHVVRTRQAWLPAPHLDINILTDRARSLWVGACAGGIHALASVLFGWRLGMADDPLGIAWALAGGVLFLGVPTYLLVRHDLVWPTAIATILFLNSIHSQQHTGPSDPHALYVFGWFVFLAIALVPGLIEYMLRRAGQRSR